MKTKPLNGYFFEDFQLNQLFVHGVSRTLSDGDRSAYIALTGARQALYCSRPAAENLGYRDMPLDDLLVFNMAFGKTVADISLNAIANLGYADVRFLAPVYAGDTIRCESLVIGLRETSSGNAGIVYVRSTCLNQNDEAVLTWIRWVMVSKRGSDPAPQPYTPDLPSYVQPPELPVTVGRLTPERIQEWSLEVASNKLWNNYSVGEEIQHPCGMTLEESDHMLATRLYQNNARVHFDGQHMQSTRMGKRLVYGGHIISICRALSNDGLESVIGISAINGGKHAAPTFAGDTLYASTKIIDKWKAPGRSDLGFLRLQLTGLKNCPPSDVAQADAGQVVLELDYTVVLPASAERSKNGRP